MSATTAGAITIPEARQSMPPTPIDRVDRVVADLAKRKDAWIQVPVADRVALLDEAIAATVEISDAWSAAGLAKKRIRPGTPAAGEELAFGPFALVRHLRCLRDTLRSLLETGDVSLPSSPYARPDGQVVVPVMPTNRLDTVLFPQTTAELWLDPAVGLDGVRTAVAYHDRPTEGRVCFVLGAGNVSSTPAIDATHKLFVEDQVVVLKMNPVNDWAGPFLDRALAAITRQGWIQIVYGGIETGQHLTTHADVDTIHMTGSDKTHDAVVFGTGSNAAKRKAANEPVIDKEVTSELGSVNPLIVVPGPWSQKDIDFHGNYIASMVTANVGFACACPRVIIQHAAWSHRNDLLAAIRRHLARVPARYPYYPGAQERWQQFVEAHPEAETFGPHGPDQVPWTLIADVDPTHRDDIVFRTEAWNGLTAEVGLDAPRDVASFLDQAVDLANDTLWGTLSCTILVHPRSLADPRIAGAVDRAVANLRFGTVAINVWAANGYGLTSPAWGAFPGHPLGDIQSGRGWVQNTYMVEDVQKSVIRAPFRLSKKPPSSYDFRTMPTLMPRLIRAEAFGDWTKLPGIVLAGLRA